MNRRDFLRTVAGSTAAAALFPLLERSRAFAGADRANVAGRFALILDGSHAGYLQSYEGGATKADDIVVRCGAGMSKGMYDRMKAAFDQNPMRKTGAIVAAEFNYKEQSRREFTNALITEVSFPTLDGASKDPAYMTVKFEPETTRQLPASASAAPLPLPSAKQKKWLCSNFRLAIGGLDCSKINKIDAFTIKQGIKQTMQTQVRTATKEPTKLDYPNLTFSVPASASDSFSNWHEDFVTQRNNGPANRKNGSLIYLDSDMKTELFTLTFKGLGISNVSPNVAMPMEQVSFSYGRAALG
ncbi:MAG: hypothetical protein ACREJQ_03115 [bacterium]